VTPIAAFGTSGGILGSRPATISARNFGSHTFTAVSFDVIGAVAPRAIANSSTGIRHRFRLCITSKYQGWDIEGLRDSPCACRPSEQPYVLLSVYETFVGAPRLIQSRTSSV
jgi:hypothetical protein